MISALWIIDIAKQGPGGRHVPPGAYFFPFINRLWDASSDPVFALFIRAVIVIVALALIPGFTIVTLAFAFLALAVGLLIGAFQLLFQLATLSLGGFLLVFVVMTGLVRWLRKKHPEDVAVLVGIFHWILDGIVAAYLKVRRAVEYGIGDDDIVPISPARRTAIMDDEERGLQTQVAKIATMLSIGHVPGQLEEYGGWLQEAFKRVQMRSRQRTNSEALVLLQQANAAYTELLKLRRAQGELGRLAKENRVKDLELDAQETDLRLRIRQSKKAIKELNKPPSPTPTHDVDAGDVD